MKVTKAQYEKWNGQLGKGWVLDLQDLVVWGEKKPRIYENISEKQKVEYSLTYMEVWEEHRFTGFYDIRLTKRVWTKSDASNCWSTSGLGCTKIIASKATNKKLFKNLAEFTKLHTLEDCKAMFTGNEVNPMA